MISKNQLKSETTVETVYTILCGSLEEYSFPPEAMAGAIIGSLIGFGFLITTIICIRKVPALKFHIRCHILYVTYIKRTKFSFFRGTRKETNIITLWLLGMKQVNHSKNLQLRNLRVRWKLVNLVKRKITLVKFNSKISKENQLKSNCGFIAG